MLEGNERHPDLQYPDTQWTYFVLADRFGWTPSQVDEQPAYLMDWMISIAAVQEEVRASKMND